MSTLQSTGWSVVYPSNECCVLLDYHAGNLSSSFGASEHFDKAGRVSQNPVATVLISSQLQDFLKIGHLPVTLPEKSKPNESGNNTSTSKGYTRGISDVITG